uniref:Uncharacterized protein n=1 Tax=Ostreococcus mediterraneus TaxID=1486918 RepID=A0A6U0E1Z5_9CHLO|mmetsp:Transcript_4464/g.16342  ORF Transcript_4464/g.16342 Transcript_4464/m.16342 type:complete len:405 (-) Transcript_4464:112-1326(-)
MLLARIAAITAPPSRRREPPPSRCLARVGVLAPSRPSRSLVVAASDARTGDDSSSWLTDMIADAIEEESRAARRADDGTLCEPTAALDDVDDDDAVRAYAATEAHAGEDDDDIDAYTSPYAHGDVDERVEGAFVGAETSSTPVVGAAAVILIGFRPEEWPRVRVLVDELGGYDVPVIPARAEHAFATLEEVAAEREPDWEAPRGVGEGASRGGGFGAQRAVAFSGLDLGEVAVLVSALESQGLPRLAVIITNEDNLRKPLGEALAVALKNARRDARRRRSGSASSASVRERTDSTRAVTSTPSNPPAVEHHREEVIPELLEPTSGAGERSGAPPIEAHSALHDVEQRAAAAEVDDNNRQRERDGDERNGIMTKRALKELADRRGLSYEALLKQAREAGASLPDF